MEFVFHSPHFKINETLECGQAFRFTKISENEYKLIANGKVLTVTQKGNNEISLSPCTADEFEKIWARYFDLATDYTAIKQKLSADPVLERAIAFAGGIRLLNQDPWETLLSFIISQNMNIPRIKKIIADICERYGDEIEGNEHAFPPPEKLATLDIPALAACRTGFRAKYLADAIHRVASGMLEINHIFETPTAELRAELLKIYGVGEKVADCVMLYGCGRREVFPTDVWVKRVMQNLYFGGRDVPMKEIHAFAAEKFGALAGYAQQYLFHYARNGGSIC